MRIHVLFELNRVTSSNTFNIQSHNVFKSAEPLNQIKSNATQDIIKIIKYLAIIMGSILFQ